MKKIIRKIALVSVLGISIMAISCTENDHSGESMTDELSTTEEMHEETHDDDKTLGEEIEEGAEELGEDIEDTAEDVKEEFDGDNTDNPDHDEKEVEEIKPE